MYVCLRLLQGSKEGKNAWKLRKEAMDAVETALARCNGLISTESLKPLVDLLRAMRERLSDSQSNLKPVAARIIGSILRSVDKVSQAKLGKIVFAPLVSAVLNDNRKPMRDESMEALRAGTTASSIEGGEPNSSALESLMVAVVGELSESEYKVRAYVFPAVKHQKS
jgi:cytoskeleton-associated protein 5